MRGLLTSVVLLLLMIVTQLAFTLSRHPPLGLHHLFSFTGTCLVSLRGIEVLKIGRRVRSERVVFGDGVMSLRDTSSHTLVWQMLFHSLFSRTRVKLTVFREWARSSRSRHGVAPRWHTEQLSALDKIVKRTFDLYDIC